MKKIEAFVKPFTVEAIKSALVEAGVERFRVVPANEFSSVKTHADVFSGTEFALDMTPTSLVVVHAEDETVDSIVDLFLQAGQTEQRGNGRIVVTALEKVIEIEASETAS
ncbi:MAG: P-II family nitrogen regulator [Rhodothermales bacterium]